MEKIFGDPTEIGLLECSESNGFMKSSLEKMYPLVSESPFDSDRKRMSIIRKTPEGVRAYVKGAPERILELISFEKL